MKIHFTASKVLCVVFAAIITLSAAACSQNSNINNNIPTGAAAMTAEGYQMPYYYDDGYIATLKVIDGSEYETISDDGYKKNKVFHFTTDKPGSEVDRFYREYFSTLQKVKPKQSTDNSVGYFDKEARLIIFNLSIWTADGKTNYKLGCEACDSLEDSEIWEAK